ncbi:MAG: two-component regulator propeller domain-containing protein [Rhodothermales bacterium]
MRSLLFLVGFLCGSALFAHAQPTYRFEHLGVEDGISESTVNVIFQDAIGFMWFGTDDGLNRYDGVNFHTYRHIPGDSLSLSSSRVTALTEDANGNLWVGTHNSLQRFDRRTETFQRVPGNPGDPQSACGGLIRALGADTEGNVWSGSFIGGLCRYTPEVGRFERAHPDTVASERIYLIEQDAAGGLWVVVSSGHGCHIRPGSSFCDLGALPTDLTPRAFAYSPSGDLWALDFGPHYDQNPRLVRLSPSQTDVTLNLPDANYGYTSVFATPHRIWLATESQGILEVDTRSGAHRFIPSDAARASSLRSNMVQVLYKDRQGTLWVGTHNGLSRWNPQFERFAHFKRETDGPGALSSNTVNGMTVDQDGTLWVTTNDGLNRYNHEQGTFDSFYRQPGVQSRFPNAFWWVTEDRSGTLWLGSKRHGLFTFDPKHEQFDLYRPLNSDVYHQDERFGEGTDAAKHGIGIRHINETRDGSLWISSWLGLARQPANASAPFISYQVDDGGLISNTINVTYEDEAGRFWIGTDNGLCRMERNIERFTCLQQDLESRTSLTSDIIWTMTTEPTTPGLLWIGTIGGGLCAHVIDTELFRCFTVQDGLQSDVVYGVLPDHRGHLWMSTNAGLVRFNARTHATRTFTADDGLQSNEFDLMSYHRDAAGWMYFGGKNGFNRFHPDSLSVSSDVPPVVFTHFDVLDQRQRGFLAPADTVTLTRHDDVFTIGFAALDYINPVKNRYRYRLAGHSPTWRTTDGRQPEASYTNVEPGAYVFEVYGSNHDGVFTSEPSRLHVILVPALWQEPWFIWGAGVFGGLLLIFSTGFVYQRRVQTLERARAEQVEMQRRLAESRERERQHIGRELHDGPMQRLYRVGHDLDKLAMSANGEAEPILDVRHQVNTVATELREVLSTLRPPLIEHLGLNAALRSLIRRLNRHHPDLQIDYRFDADASAWPLDVQHMLYRVTQEALNNVSKHAQAQRLRIQISQHADEIVLLIRDNGRGFRKPDKLIEWARAQHFGLAGAAERVELMGGRLGVASAPGQGTTLRVTLPLMLLEE